MTALYDAQWHIDEWRFNAWVGRGAGKFKWLLGQGRDPNEYEGEDGVTFRVECPLAEVADTVASFPASLVDHFTVRSLGLGYELKLLFEVQSVTMRVLPRAKGDTGPLRAEVTAVYLVTAWNPNDKEFYEGRWKG